MPLPSDSLYARGFASDAVTWRALRAGLAGRKVKLQRGRLAVALRALASEPAAKILFVDLDGVAEPEVAGRQLATVCSFEDRGDRHRLDRYRALHPDAVPARG